MIEENKIILPNLIICEGPDDKNYLKYFLQSIIKTDDRFEKFQVMEVGGKDKLSIFIKTLPSLPRFFIVRSVVVTRDSDNNPQRSSESVQAALKKGGFSIPSLPGEIAYPAEGKHKTKVAYVLFPNFNSEHTPGTLEDLCLNTLASPNNDRILKIVDNAIETVKIHIDELKHPHKNKLHTYLSLTDDFVGLKIGEAAKANAFNFSANETKVLKTLLAKMLE